MLFVQMPEKVDSGVMMLIGIGLRFALPPTAVYASRTPVLASSDSGLTVRKQLDTRDVVKCI